MKTSGLGKISLRDHCWLTFGYVCVGVGGGGRVVWRGGFVCVGACVGLYVLGGLCVRACMQACVRACVRVCVRVCVRACVRASLQCA